MIRGRRLQGIIYTRIATIIKEQGISVRELARDLGMVHTTLLRKLHGETPFKLDEAIELSNILVGEEDHVEWLFSKNI